MGYIYMIYNDINMNFYIGSTTNKESREYRHFRDLKNGNHHSKYLQRAYNKYGREHFHFIVIDECEDENLIALEQMYLDKVDFSCGNCYNVSKVASNCVLFGEKNGMCGLKGENNPNYGKRRTEESKKKISDALKGKAKSISMKEKLSKTRKEKFKLGEIVIHNKGKKMSDEQRDKISKARKIPVVCINVNTMEILKIYDSIKDASEELGIDSSSIAKCCKGKVKTAGKFLWKYL